MTRVLRSMLIALCVAMTPGVLTAHEGHDHAPAAAPPVVESPRVSLQSEKFEIVAFPNGAELIIYLDDADSNEPVRNAALTVESAGRQASARDLAAGIYSVGDWIKQPGKHALTITIAVGEQKDQLSGTLLIAAPAA